jgi:hypothetical protein
VLSSCIRGLAGWKFASTLTQLRGPLSAEPTVEIKDVIETGDPIPTGSGRQRKAKVFDFAQERFGKTYPQKRVEVVYVMEQDVAVTVTVYVFFGEWKGEQ